MKINLVHTVAANLPVGNRCILSKFTRWAIIDRCILLHSTLW